MQLIGFIVKFMLHKMVVQIKFLLSIQRVQVTIHTHKLLSIHQVEQVVPMVAAGQVAPTELMEVLVQVGQAELRAQVAQAEAAEQVELMDLAVQAAPRGQAEQMGQVAQAEAVARRALTEVAELMVLAAQVA
jgi:hypothetical protein